MAAIVTVLGEISPGALGFCHSHEHLSIDKGPSRQVNPALCIDDIDRTAQELALFKQAGGAAIVDAQPVGCGRNAAALRQLAERSGIHIIASTGFHKMQFYPPGHWIHHAPREQLAEWFTRELTEGMFVDADDALPEKQLSARAGQIKAALDSGPLTQKEKRLFAAAADAAKATGASLMVHIEKDSQPVQLADCLAELGVSPAKTAFCHMDRMIPDLAVHRALCARGLYMEYDTIARPKYHDDNTEIQIVQELAAAGYSGRLLMGLDTTRERMLSYGGGVGLGYIRRTFAPLLEKTAGKQLTEDIFIHNPARFFSQP